MASAAQPQTTAVATTDKKESPVAALLLTHRTRLEHLLPEGVSLDRIVAQVRMEAMKNPKILDCTPQSIIESIGRIQQWGLEIGVTAYLVPYKDRCTAIADYKGLAQLMVNSRAVRAVQARAVFANEKFSYKYGLDEELVHQPIHDPRGRGSLIGAYAILRLPGGRDVFEFMSIEDIEVIRRTHSKQWGPDKVKDCPPWYAKKTVVRQVAKLVPKNPKFAHALEVIDQELEIEGHVDEDGPAPTEDADWKVDDDEPAVLEQSAAPSAPATPAPEAALPKCPDCRGDMYDNRATKRNPKAPDFKCRDRSCDGVLWPGQWPPKPKDAAQEDIPF